MASVTQTNLEELKDLILGINQRFDSLENRLLQLEQRVEIGFTEIKGELKRIDERINSLEQRIEDTNSRIDDSRSSLEKK
jgi:septal ring factor EnvC (AmiA/AmiB activator)